MSMFVSSRETHYVPYRTVKDKGAGKQEEGPVLAYYTATPLTGKDKRKYTRVMNSPDVPISERLDAAWEVFQKKVTGVVDANKNPVSDAPEFDRNAEGLRHEVMDKINQDVIYYVGAQIIAGDCFTEEDAGN